MTAGPRGLSCRLTKAMSTKTPRGHKPPQGGDASFTDDPERERKRIISDQRPSRQFSPGLTQVRKVRKGRFPAFGTRRPKFETPMGATTSKVGL